MILSSAVVALSETNAALSTGGTLTITDVDSPRCLCTDATAGANGIFNINSAGAWTHGEQADNLNVGQSVSDTFTAASMARRAR
jgi:VCBS repeat-containing protein